MSRAFDLHDLVAARGRMRRRQWLAVLVLGLVALSALIADLMTGASLSAREVLGVLLAPGSADPVARTVVIDMRLAAGLTAVLAGAALALAGAEMQVLLANPLAEPFTLGVSSAAAVGAGFAIVFGLVPSFVPAGWGAAFNALLTALAMLALLQMLAMRRRAGKGALILIGIGTAFAAEALLRLMQIMASAEALQQLTFWSLGSLERGGWTGVAALGALLAVCLPFSLRAAPRMTALHLGEDRARSVGVDIHALRFWSLLRIGLLAAGTVALIGIVGFVGLAGPHIARLLTGEDHRLMLPASAFAGAAMMALASCISKLVLPGVVLPISLVTTLVGLPLFFWLVLRRVR